MTAQPLLVRAGTVSLMEPSRDEGVRYLCVFGNRSANNHRSMLSTEASAVHQALSTSSRYTKSKGPGPLGLPCNAQHSGVAYNPCLMSKPKFVDHGRDQWSSAQVGPNARRRFAVARNGQASVSPGVCGGLQWVLLLHAAAILNQYSRSIVASLSNLNMRV